MKKTSGSQKTGRVAPRKGAPKTSPDELRPQYDFDYSKARTNRFAAKFAEGSVAVVLDPDVATVFRSAEAVNAFLRSAISAMPHEAAPKKRRAS